jgi:cytochrome c oxidase subunit II
VTRRHPSTRRPRSALLVLLAGASLLTSCNLSPRDSITEPVSPQAAEIDWLWQLSLWMGTVVWIIVMILVAVPILRSRRHRDDDQRDREHVGPQGPGRTDGTRSDDAGRGDDEASVVTDPTADAEVATEPPGDVRLAHRGTAPGAELDEPMITADVADHDEAQVDERVRSRLLWIGGIIGPAIILLILLMASGRVGALTAHVERDEELVVDVIGHMFWWEVSYPEEDIVTANEINVPVDRPVRLNLTTEDVIHSFWIPRVHGKIDMIPGHENILSFEPTETGRFRGQCAEYCGIAHAQMVAFLEVMEPDDYDEWVEAQQADAVEPETPSEEVGKEVFIESGCAACHAVRGTEAVAEVGPDLTNLASRGSLAAGIVPNTRENLEELIVDPWGLKPGNPMPPTILDDDELEALLDYLEVLE